MSAGLRLAAATTALAGFAAAMWFIWLGWDHEYYDVGGVAQGPYRPWQVVGCGLAIVAAAALAQLLTRTKTGIVLLAVAAVVGFAIPWSVDAASTDDTGLWVVGLVLLLAGGGTGLLVVLAITESAARMRRTIGR